VTLADVQAHYDETVMAEDGARLLIQLRGRAFASEPFAVLPNAPVIDDIEAFHKTMSQQ